MALSNTATRVLVALAGIPLLAGAIIIGDWFFWGVFSAIALLSLYEYFLLSKALHLFPQHIGGYILAFLLLIGLSSPIAESLPIHSLTAIVFLAPPAVLALELWRNKHAPLHNAAVTLFGLLYVIMPFVAVLKLRFADFDKAHIPIESGSWLILSVFIGIWLCDSVAFFVGKSFGKHPLFKRVSPKKSWEGAIGGFLASAVGYAFFAQWFLPFIPLHHAVVLGSLIGITGQIGDLAESLLKRSAGIKDSSNLIPGHGGFLDRFDSILFAAPTTYIYLLLFI